MKKETRKMMRRKIQIKALMVKIIKQHYKEKDFTERKQLIKSNVGPSKNMLSMKNLSEFILIS
jgi:hypothetical protein